MSIWRDIRFGARTLRNSKGFAITSVITMALGIGATTAVYSLADGMLWKPVPLPGLDQLAMVMERIPNETRQWNWDSTSDALDIRRQAASFSAITEWNDGMANVVGAGGEPERVYQYLVAANFFDVVGVQPVVGRGFQTGEDQLGQDHVVVLSDPLWRRLFGADPQIVGRIMRLDDEDYTVIGIMPPQFSFPKAAELWTPLALTPKQRNTRTEYHVAMMGRVKPGVNVERAGAELDAISARLAREYPDTNKNRRFAVIGLHEFLVGPYNHDYVMLLFYAVLFVLLIACVNVANLQFARATGRAREIAVRSALGAGRRRVVLQLITESVMLSLCGAILGLVVAAWGLDMIRAYMPPEVEKYVVGWRNIRLDGRALFFTLFAAVASGIFAGVAPAWQSSRPNLFESLKEGGRGSTVGRAKHRFRGLLVASEVALASVLLVGAGLMVHGFQTTLAAGSRFEPSTLLTLRMTLTKQKYPKEFQRAEFYREVLARTAAIPGVRSSLVATALPFSDHSSAEGFTIEGKPVTDHGNNPWGMYQLVSANYFQVLHVPLIAGRLVAESDGAESTKVAVISEKLARQWWPGEALPVGKRILIGKPAEDNPWVTIVGVVGNVPHDSFERDPQGVLYVPFVQAPRLWMDIGIRTAGDPLRVAQAVTAAIRSIDPEQPITDLCSMETLRYRNGLGLAYVATMMAIFGVVALILAAVGVYGVMAYLVSHQTHEIGVRMALGAPRSTVLRMVFRRGMLTTLGGLAVGLALSYKLAGLMSSLVFGVSATDPATFVGIPLVLVVTAAVAIYVPARRAMRIDPIRALRYE